MCICVYFQAFVTLIVFLTLSVTIAFYTCLLPLKYEESVGMTVVHFVAGHYVLFCTIFYYFRAAFTDPGYPPEVRPIKYRYVKTI